MLRDDGDERRLTERHLLGLEIYVGIERRRLVEALLHRDLGAVVFDDVRNLQLAADERGDVVAEAEAFVDVRGPEHSARRLDDRIVVGRRADDRVLVDDRGRRVHHHLCHAEVVEQLERLRQQADEALGDGRELLRDVAGVAVAAAGGDRRPEVGPKVQAGVRSCATGLADRPSAKRNGARVEAESLEFRQHVEAPDRKRAR